jgi:putative DNA primase/helicase
VTAESPRPARSQVHCDTIPLALTKRRQWLGWRYELRGGRWTKVPYCPDGRRASSTAPATWSTFAAVLAVYRAGLMDGVGYVFSPDDPYAGIDLDKCRETHTGVWAAWALDIIASLASYTEITPSQAGAHIIVEATLPPRGRKRGPVEMYDRERYFTVTGQRLDGTPAIVAPRQAELTAVHRHVFGPDNAAPSPAAAVARKRPNLGLDDAGLIARAHRARNGSRFAALWRGAWQAAGYPSASEADAALAMMLLFWTAGDVARADLLFRESGLYREKWDARHAGDGATYGALTLQHAAALANRPRRLVVPTRPSAGQRLAVERPG